MSDIRIEVMSKAQAEHSGAADVATKVDVDQGPLAMPSFIAIGQITMYPTGETPKHKLVSYADMVGDYDCWLEERIKAQDPDVLAELDRIYNLGTRGVILLTICMPQPFWTAAHVIKRTIEELAAQAAGEPVES